MQALNRTQPIRPLAPGVPARQTHDYERHGVTSLFAAMDVASGVTISSCYRRHRHQEFLRFLEEIETNLPKDLDVHLIMDNYATPKVPKVQTWLLRHPRYHVHFTPTSSSWLNLVERLFAEVTTSVFAEAATPVCRTWRRPCSLTLIAATRIPDLSSGPLPPSSSSAKFNAFVRVFLTQDTSPS